VFGEVLAGKSIIRQIENLPTQSDKPAKDCTIVDCGELTGSDAETLPQKQADKTGDPYEDYPEDQRQGDDEIPGPELLKIASDLKGFGNTAFKAQDFPLALAKYQKGLRYLLDFPESPLNSEPKEVNQLKITLHSNSALCYNKVQNYGSAVTSATAALETPGITDAEKGKAYYRRALAKGGSKDEEGALADLEQALKCVPGDSAITNELSKMKAKAADRERKEKAAYKKFFA